MGEPPVKTLSPAWLWVYTLKAMAAGRLQRALRFRTTLMHPALSVRGRLSRGWGLSLPAGYELTSKQMRRFSGEEMCMCAGRGWKCVLVGECLNSFLGCLIFVGGDTPSGWCCYITILVHIEYNEKLHSQMSDLYGLFSYVITCFFLHYVITITWDFIIA